MICIFLYIYISVAMTGWLAAWLAGCLVGWLAGLPDALPLLPPSSPFTLLLLSSACAKTTQSLLILIPLINVRLKCDVVAKGPTRIRVYIYIYKYKIYKIYKMYSYTKYELWKFDIYQKMEELPFLKLFDLFLRCFRKVGICLKCILLVVVYL